MLIPIYLIQDVERAAQDERAYNTCLTFMVNHYQFNGLTQELKAVALAMQDIIDDYDYLFVKDIYNELSGEQVTW